MGRLTMQTKRKKPDDLYIVDRVWDRRVEDDGSFKYLTSWKGYSEKTWEPMNHFTTEDAMELVKDLEKIMDDPDNNPKPQWLIEYEEMKAKGVNVLKRTPGYNKTATALASASRSSSLAPPEKRARREDSVDTRRTSGRTTRTAAEAAVNYSDVRRRVRGGGPAGDEGTPTRALAGGRATRASLAAAATAPAPSATPPPALSVDSSRTSTRQSDHAESDDEEEEVVQPRAVKMEQPEPEEEKVQEEPEDEPEEHPEEQDQPKEPEEKPEEEAEEQPEEEDESMEEQKAAEEDKVVPEEPEKEEVEESEEDQEGPSSSSTVAADDAAKEVEPAAAPLVVDVPEEMREPLVISPPALASPTNLLAASPASTVLSPSAFDSAGILLPLPEEEDDFGFVPFDWAAHIEREGGEVAPLNCFWKRRIGKFHNPFGDHIGRALKVPDHDELFTWEWCTVGTVKSVHGPWVQVHAVDTDPVLAQWFMSDDACLQEFINLTDGQYPKCKQPNKRRSTGNYHRIIEKVAFINGVDNRAPRACFEQQLPWKNRPIANLFKVGHKLETYDPVRGEGCFYPATVVEVIAAKELVKVHYDGYPESHCKTVPYNDNRLFPCGFAAAIGWKCILPVGQMGKKSENRGRKKVSNAAAPISPPIRTSPPVVSASRPTPPQPANNRTPQPPNNNNEKKRKIEQPRRSEQSRVRPNTYKESSTNDEDEDSDDEEEEVRTGYAARFPTHRTRAPAIPGLQKRVDGMRVEAAPKVEEKRASASYEPPAKKPAPAPAPAGQMTVARQTTPVARQMTPLSMDDFPSERSSSREAVSLPITELRFSHTGNLVFAFLNHSCNVGVNIHPEAFSLIPSKMKGSIPHLWREILQQLMNASVDSAQFAECLPKYSLGKHTTAMCVTYDDCINSTVCRFLLPPPNMVVARTVLAKVLKDAGMCPKSVTFDARQICEKCKYQEPSDTKVLDILRNANLQQQQIKQHQMKQAQIAAANQERAQQQLQMQQQQLLAMRSARIMQHIVNPASRNATPPMQQQPMMRPPMPPQQQQQRQQTPLAAPQPPPQRMQAPPTPQQQHQRVQAPPAPQQLIQRVQVVLPAQPPTQRVQPLPPVQPPPQRQPAPVPAAAPAVVARPPAPAAPAVALDDPNRLINQKVNINTLTENEIIETLQTLKIPEHVCDVFRRKKINYRSLVTLTEDIMVEHLQIPRQFAKMIHDYIEFNKEE